MQHSQTGLAEGLPSPTLPPPHQRQPGGKVKVTGPNRPRDPLPEGNGGPRSQPLSPVSVAGSEWSGMNGYAPAPSTNSPYSPFLPYNRGDLVTPLDSGSNNGPSGNNMNGGFQQVPRSLGPSPPVSIANSRSSDGTLSDQQSKKYRRMEAELLQHYSVLKAFLRGGAPLAPRANKARDKLLRLTPVQFHELSTDVFDELQRRQAANPPQGPPGRPPPRNVPHYLLPRDDFHEKRNQARQKLSTLQDSRFRDLSTDVYCELERRFPHFQRIDNSPGPRVHSRGPPSAGPNGFGLPPRTQSRGAPGAGTGKGPPAPNFPRRSESMSGSLAANGVPQFDNPPLPESDRGRPMPKQFQSNTIMPNKSTMVEDDDEYSASGYQDRRSDAFGLDGIAASLPNNRDTTATSRSAGSLGRDAKLVVAAQAQVAELQEKVDELEQKVRKKDQDIHRLEEETKSSMSSEWVDVKQDLEKKLEDAEGLNRTMKEELERFHTDQANVERDLRSQLEMAKKSQSNGDAWKSKHQRLERDYQDLLEKLTEQKKVTEEVRQQASGFLSDMRAMADGGGGTLEREERLQSDVQRLEEEVKEWKGRYIRTKTQLRNIRASSLGLSSQKVDASRLAQDETFSRPDGLVKDVHITKFQIAIDELLHVARTGEPSAVLDYMKAVVVAVRSITQDVVTTPGSQKGDEILQREVKLRSKVSATANNVITASKNFAASNGISPVSLLDAAASHLTAAIVELVKTVKIRPTPAGELEGDDDGAVEPISSPGYFSVDHPLRRASGNDSVYSAVSTPPAVAARQGGHRRKQSGSRQSNFVSNGITSSAQKPTYGMRPKTNELEELKV